MISKTIANMNLTQIADSGQCFRWEKQEENVYRIPHRDKVLTAVCNRTYSDIAGGEFLFDCSEAEWNTVWNDYFDIDTDYAQIGKRILDSGDVYLKECYQVGCGIRILRQDIWEIIVSFIISQNNNIARIRKSIRQLCQLTNGVFPRSEEIDLISHGLFDIGVGYRAAYLEDIFSYVKNNPDWLHQITLMESDGAYEELLKRNGIGPKVANCICLFGLHHIERFPIDTHIRQILDVHYSEGFPFEYYSGVAGIVQQYMFYAKQHMQKL